MLEKRVYSSRSTPNIRLELAAYIRVGEESFGGEKFTYLLKYFAKFGGRCDIAFECDSQEFPAIMSARSR